MNFTATMNAVILATILLLTGCLGLLPDDDTVSAEEVDAMAETPVIHAEVVFFDAVEVNQTSTFLIAYHAVLASNHSNLEMGWDLDLDTEIDVFVTAPHGFTNLTIGNETFAPHPLSDGIWTTIAFIVHTETGGTTGTMLTSSTEMFFAPPAPDYVFTAEDAGGTVSANTDDALVRVAMTQGSGINWASLDVKITVGEGTPMTCDRSEAGDGSDVETDCYMAEYGTTNDAEWTIGDGVTIYENGQNLCGAGQSCAVEVVIVNSREGQTLDESNTVAE